MKIEKYKPNVNLKSIIDSYTIIEANSAFDTIVLPHLGFVMAIQIEGKVSLKKGDPQAIIPSTVISGIRNSYRKFYYEPNTGVVLINFSITGISNITPEPLHQLFEKIISAENFFKVSAIKELEEKISLEKNNKERVKHIDDFFLSKMIKKEPDPVVCYAIQQIIDNQGLGLIATLHTNLGISQDNFEKRFRRLTGTSPKQFSNIVRMRTLVQNGYQADLLTQLAFNFDYYDQSHFIKHFKNFTGQTPKNFFKSQYAWG